MIKFDLHIHSIASKYKESSDIVDNSTVENAELLLTKLEENDNYMKSKVKVQLDKLIGKVVYSCPKTMHKMGYYQLEKIFSYLYVRSTEIDPLSNESWGLKQAHAFSQGFAKEWVTIDVNTMSYEGLF
mgnify:CR=1 FL=1